MANDTNDVPKFGDVLKKGRAYPMAKDYKPDQILGKEFELIEYQDRPSRFAGRPSYNILHGYSKELNPDNGEISIGAGGAVIAEQLAEWKAKGCPRVKVKIVKPPGKEYYRLS